MHLNQLTEDTVRTLSEVEADEPVVVSLFLDLDPAQFATATARSSQITSLLSDLDAALRDDALSADAVEALAVYASHALDVLEVVKLADPVESAVHVDLRPILEPVMGREEDGAWCVLLV